MRKCTNIFTIKRSLVIYDFAPDPSKFPNKWGKFYFLLYQCILLAVNLLNSATTVKDLLQYSIFASIYITEKTRSKNLLIKTFSGFCGILPQICALPPNGRVLKNPRFWIYKCDKGNSCNCMLGEGVFANQEPVRSYLYASDSIKIRLIHVKLQFLFLSKTPTIQYMLSDTNDAPTPPPPLHTVLANYGPMIYTAPYVMCLMRA